MAYYPGPAGATESLLPLDAWEALVSQNPPLQKLQPDVEALLVNRAGKARNYFIAPIDKCYELVGRSGCIGAVFPADRKSGTKLKVSFRI